MNYKTYDELKREYMKKYPLEKEEEKTECGFNPEWLEKQYEDYVSDCLFDDVTPKSIDDYETDLYDYWSSSIF